MNTKYAWNNGKELEAKVREILTSNGLKFKEQVSLTDFDLRVDFLVAHNTTDFAIEVSQRNTNEDIQRMAFRCFVYKNFLKTPIKTITIVPHFTASTRSLRLFMFLLKFSDMFLFSEDLDLLTELIGNNDLFTGYVIDKLNTVYPESKQLLELLKVKSREFTNHKELSELTGINVNKVRRLFYDNHLSFEKLGIVERFGSHCRLGSRFLI